MPSSSQPILSLRLWSSSTKTPTGGRTTANQDIAAKGWPGSAPPMQERALVATSSSRLRTSREPDPSLTTDCGTTAGRLHEVYELHDFHLHKLQKLNPICVTPRVIQLMQVMQGHRQVRGCVLKR